MFSLFLSDSSIDGSEKKSSFHIILHSYGQERSVMGTFVLRVILDILY